MPKYIDLALKKIIIIKLYWVWIKINSQLLYTSPHRIIFINLYAPVVKFECSYYVDDISSSYNLLECSASPQEI